MNAKFAILAALMVAFLPVVFAFGLIDLAAIGYGNLVLLAAALVVVWLVTGLWGVLVTCAILVNVFIAWTLIGSMRQRPALRAKSPPKLATADQMKYWCANYLRSRGWKVKFGTFGIISMTVSKDDHVAHLCCAGGGTIVLPSMLSELAKTVRNTGAPVILVLDAEVSDVIQDRADESEFSVIHWRDLDRLSTFKRRKRDRTVSERPAATSA